MNERLAEARLRLQRAREASATPAPAPIDPDKIIEMIGAPSSTPSTDGPVVGLMSHHYLSDTEVAWAGPEARRVIDKLNAASLLVFADRFGMVMANLSEVPYTLVGPHTVPCHPQFNWNGPIDFKGLSVDFIIAGAQDVLTMTHLASAEAFTSARLHVVQTCDVLVLVAGSRGFREWQDSADQIIHIDKLKQETTRYARRPAR